MTSLSSAGPAKDYLRWHGYVLRPFLSAVSAPGRVASPAFPPASLRVGAGKAHDLFKSGVYDTEPAVRADARRLSLVLFAALWLLGLAYAAVEKWQRMEAESRVDVGEMGER